MIKTQIDFVPDLTKLPYITSAYKSNKLVIFVGAGLSTIWGCKRWRDMSVALIEDCYSSNQIDYWIRENLLMKHGLSPRKLITIAKKILGDNYADKIKHTLIPTTNRKDKFPSLFKNLFALNATFITTNIDNHLSSLFDPSNIHTDVNKFDLEHIKPGNIFHLHGTVDNPNGWVLTIDEYVNRYRNKKIRNFLEHVFINGDYCILFVGYGVDEIEIIDYMIENIAVR